MMSYTSINDYLVKCVKNNYHCQHCNKNHNGICFFAFECFMDNMKYYDEDDDECPCTVYFEDNCNNCTKGDLFYDC